MSQILETRPPLRARPAHYSTISRGGESAIELKGELRSCHRGRQASEKLIVERLIAAFPGHSIVAEEGGGQQASSEYRWYVDPLDGTTNFAHGFPVYNVSIGLEKARELIAGRRLRSDPRRDVFGGAGFRAHS